MFNKLNSDSRGDYSVLLIGCILFTYGFSELLWANGIISVFFMGYWLGNSQFPAKKYVTSFLESISVIFNMALFIMLGLLAFPHRFVNIWKDALIIVAVMMFVARPLAILISTIPFKYSLKEKTFMMWGGIKGAVPIVLATYPVEAGLDSNGFIFDTIFFAVFLSCLIQGMTLAPLSKLFEFTEKRKVDSPHTVELHSLKASEIDMFEVTVDERSANIDKKIEEHKRTKTGDRSRRVIKIVCGNQGKERNEFLFYKAGSFLFFILIQIITIFFFSYKTDSTISL